MDLIYTNSDTHTKPFGYVGGTLSLFERKMDPGYICVSDDLEQQRDKEKGLLMKELANYKLQVDIAESDNMEARLKLEIFWRTIADLAERLKSSEAEAERHSRESKQAKHLVARLQSRYNMIFGRFSESNNEQERSLEGVEDSDVTRFEQLITEAEYVVSADSEDVVSRLADSIDRAASVDKLEDELLEKIVLIDYLMLELKQQKEMNSLYAGAASDAMDELNRLIADMEKMEMANSEKASHIISVESGFKRLEDELKSARDEAKYWRSQFKAAKTEMHGLTEGFEREFECKAEVASLKSELQKSRSTIASLEASQARALSSQSGMYLAVQKLAQELETAKNEALLLKHEAKKAEALLGAKKPEAKIEDEVRDIAIDSFQLGSSIRLSVKEYESLIRKAKRADEIALYAPKEPERYAESVIENNLRSLREEMDAANNKRLSKLQFSLEEALRRAIVAEEAKSSAEEKLRKLRGRQKKRGNSASGGHTKQVISKQGIEISVPLCETDASKCVTLGKMLNMEY